MGFDKNRSKKALLINKMNFQMAMEFLLINVGNPYLDQPLTFIELQNIAKFFQTQEELSNFKNPLVDEAIKNNCCTFVVTGKIFNLIRSKIC
jgi:uncharacterized UBP type Zn finger protein